MGGRGRDLLPTPPRPARPTIGVMRVQISNRAQLGELIEALGSEPNAIVERLNEHELEVSLLGSYAAGAMRMQLYLRVRAWEAARRAADARVEIVG